MNAVLIRFAYWLLRRRGETAFPFWVEDAVRPFPIEERVIDHRGRRFNVFLIIVQIDGVPVPVAPIARWSKYSSQYVKQCAKWCETGNVTGKRKEPAHDQA